MKMKLPFKQSSEEENLFDENFDITEVMGAMTGMVEVQQHGALALTKLILEYCKDEAITKDYVFEVFQEAVDVLKDSLLSREED